MKKKYYRSYEDRYQTVYSQGVKYWSGFPQEVAEELAGLEAFLEFAGACPDTHRILEPGCGEGHLAVVLAERGFRYVGVDLAPSAIAKARRRLEEAGLTGLAEFLLHDATDLSCLPEAEFDMALDNKFLHMLVVDGDREKYLATLHNVLKPGAYVMFNELHREDAYDGPITSFEQYMEVFRPDLATVEERTAYNDGTMVKVHIPRVPARFKDKRGYAAELERAGFRMVRFQVLESYMGCRFYAEVRR